VRGHSVDMKRVRSSSPETIELWRARIAEWKASGKTQKVYCADKGFSRHSLTGWSSRLRVLSAGRSPLPKKTIGVPLAQVIRQQEPSAKAPTPAGHVVLEVGELRVQLDASCDRELLRSVIEALRG
jgi:hypothetical protein